MVVFCYVREKRYIFCIGCFRHTTPFLPPTSSPPFFLFTLTKILSNNNKKPTNNKHTLSPLSQLFRFAHVCPISEFCIQFYSHTSHHITSHHTLSFLFFCFPSAADSESFRPRSPLVPGPHSVSIFTLSCHVHTFSSSLLHPLIHSLLSHLHRSLSLLRLFSLSCLCVAVRCFALSSLVRRPSRPVCRYQLFDFFFSFLALIISLFRLNSCSLLSLNPINHTSIHNTTHTTDFQKAAKTDSDLSLSLSLSIVSVFLSLFFFSLSDCVPVSSRLSVSRLCLSVFICLLWNVCSVACSFFSSFSVCFCSCTLSLSFSFCQFLGVCVLGCLFFVLGVVLPPFLFPASAISCGRWAEVESKTHSEIEKTLVFFCLHAASLSC